MHYKTLFRILTKLLGVYFVVEGGAQLMTIVATALAMELMGSPRADRSWQFLNLIYQVLLTAAGAYLFFFGQKVVALAVPSNRPYCAECGYELSNSPSDVCPECGTHRRSGGQDNPASQ